MTLHVSSKLFVIVLVVAALITAFRAPTKSIDIRALPGVILMEKVNVKIAPTVSVVPAKALEIPVATATVVPAKPLEMPVATVELVVPVEEAVVEEIAAEPVVQEVDSAEAMVEVAPEITEAEVVAEAAPTLELPTYTLKSTAYNSHASQTDSSPNVTATGATTAFGVIAMSRDMLGLIPYGSLVRLKDLGSYRSGRGEGKFQEVLNTQDLFIVEDTMHPRKLEQIDVWFADHSEALNWGVRKVELEVVRVGRDGPMLEATVVAVQ